MFARLITALLLAVGCAPAGAGRTPRGGQGATETRTAGDAVVQKDRTLVSDDDRAPGRVGDACEGHDEQGTCEPGLLCCLNFHGRCGGAQPPPDAEREPCEARPVCAAVARCWGPPP